jgi:hypothetical protein
MRLIRFGVDSKPMTRTRIRLAATVASCLLARIACQPDRIPGTRDTLSCLSHNRLSNPGSGCGHQVINVKLIPPGCEMDAYPSSSRETRFIDREWLGVQVRAGSSQGRESLGVQVRAGSSQDQEWLGVQGQVRAGSRSACRCVATLGPR